MSRTRVGKISFADDIIEEYRDRVSRALKLTAEALVDEIREEQIVPFDTGQLQNTKFWADTSTADKGYVSLVFEGPYARRLYFHPEYNFHREPWVDKQGKQHGGNPNAQAYWLGPWQPGGKYERRPHELFAKFLREDR